MNEQNPEDQTNVIQVDEPNIESDEQYELWMEKWITPEHYDRSYLTSSIGDPNSPNSSRVPTPEEGSTMTKTNLRDVKTFLINRAKGDPVKLKIIQSTLQETAQQYYNN